MAYSVQQIKFDCLTYIKEFGARMDEWVIGMADDPEKALFDACGVDQVRDIWLWKPALSPAAARTVIDFMTIRYQVNPAPGFDAGRVGHCIFMFKKLPTGAEAR